MHQFERERTPDEMDAIMVEILPAEPPTKQDVLDQLDAEVVRQFLAMIAADAD